MGLDSQNTFLLFDYMLISVNDFDTTSLVASCIDLVSILISCTFIDSCPCREKLSYEYRLFLSSEI